MMSGCLRMVRGHTWEKIGRGVGCDVEVSRVGYWHVMGEVWGGGAAPFWQHCRMIRLSAGEHVET